MAGPLDSFTGVCDTSTPKDACFCPTSNPCYCLPPQYQALNEQAAIAKIGAYLQWDQSKVHKLWAKAADLSALWQTIVDPRLLLAILRIEGTGSFNTNTAPAACDDGGGPQPDQQIDLDHAADNSVLRKLMAWGKMAVDFQTSSATARAAANEFSACTASGPVTVKYTGPGDMFEYLNYYTPKLVSDTSSAKYHVEYGVYACDWSWHNKVRQFFIDMSSAELADKYSRLLRDRPFPWPENLAKPSAGFVVKQYATDSTGNYGGYPALVYATATGSCVPGSVTSCKEGRGKRKALVCLFSTAFI